MSDGSLFTRDNILSFAAEAAEVGVAGIRLCGEGEDTLHSDYLDFLLVLRSAGINILQITNGKTAWLYAPIFARCLDVVRFSVNGWSPETYASKHGENGVGAFASVVEGIAAVSAERKLIDRDGLPFVCISSVLYPEDTFLYSLVDLQDLVQNTNVDHVILKENRECSRTSGPAIVRFGTQAALASVTSIAATSGQSDISRFLDLCAEHLPGKLRQRHDPIPQGVPNWIEALHLGCILRYIRVEVERFHIYNCSVVHDYYGDSRQGISLAWRSVNRERGIAADLLRDPLICGECGWRDLFT